MKRNFLVDIDGTITEDVPNEEVERMSTVEPFPGAVTSLRLLKDAGCTVTFFTSRTEDMRGITEAWLAKWGIEYDGLIMGKPRGGNYVWIDNLQVQYLNYPNHVDWIGCIEDGIERRWHQTAKKMLKGADAPSS